MSGFQGCFSYIKAMKSSPLLRPFGDLKFCRFSLLKIKIGWVLSKFRFANSPTVNQCRAVYFLQI